MTELRLAPAALATWAAVAAICLGAPLAWVLLVLVAAAAVAALRYLAEALLAGACALAAALVAAARRVRAADFAQPRQVAGTLVEQASVFDGGALWRLRVEGLPVPLTAFITEEHAQPYPAGTRVVAEVAYQEASRPGLAQVSARVLDVHALAQPVGGTAGIRATFREVAGTAVGESSRGLIPGMVLGDTAGQSAAWQDRFEATGLSHLTAVSGANVAIVLSVAVIGCALLGLGLRVQVAACAVLLIGFVALVGTEPSVLRAAVTGAVGLLAVLGSARMEPAHGLAVAVLVLLFYDSELAVDWGFALSVVATAGIVALHPLLYRQLAAFRLPEVLTRALAVAIAADLVTMPLVAAMTGQVSAVSVLANLLVAAAVAPVTVVGLIAVAVAQAWPEGAGLLLKVIEPASWWIATVARHLAAWPFARVEATPLAVVTAAGWLVYLALAGRPRVAAAYCAVVLAGCVVFGYHPAG